MADVDPLDKRCMPLNCDGCEASSKSALLAVTMYELLPDSNRIGQIQMYSIVSQDGTYHLKDLSKFDCPGVFDLRWRPCQSNLPHVHEGPETATGAPDGAGNKWGSIEDGGELAALALADGSCQLVDIRHDSITAVAAQPDAACGGMNLSCDWSSFGATDVFSSASNGMLSQCRIAESALVQVQQWQAHEMETWMVTCDLHKEHVVYSGDDSCSFKGWDTRAAAEQMFCNRRGHGAGVCCIQSHPTHEHEVATGSYDENLRMWDLRNPAAPLMTYKVGLGGGVWRLKWHPQKADTALVACMQNGFAVVECGQSPAVHSYPHQKVLGYGADWVRCGNDWLAATCSFYDKSLHIWKYDEAHLMANESMLDVGVSTASNYS